VKSSNSHVSFACNLLLFIVILIHFSTQVLKSFPIAALIHVKYQGVKVHSTT